MLNGLFRLLWPVAPAFYFAIGDYALMNDPIDFSNTESLEAIHLLSDKSVIIHLFNF